MVPLPRTSDKAKQKICSKCAASFTCGPEKGQEKCWCDDLPHVPLVTGEDTGCLCPNCLREAISKRSSGQLDAVDIRPLMMTHQASLPSLIEGEDYYCEGANIVFTARYHLRRGYCCESGCRHCPYRGNAT
jgi:hypothetical protein